MPARVLVVEDEPIVALELVQIVESVGCTAVGPFESSCAALRVASAQPPDVALIDGNLTDGPTGPLLAAALVSKFNVAVIAITGNPEMFAEASCSLRGLLAKPFSGLELATLLSAIKDGH